MSLTSSIASVRIDAPAKLNLCLEVLGRRPDGFHELRTLMATIGLRDTLRVVRLPADGVFELRVGGDARLKRAVPTDGSNLVTKALRLLREASGRAFGARVSLLKRVPARAGLGGGSSDAAAALLAGARLLELEWSLERIQELGGRLGSDVPFFVAAIGDRGHRAAVASGRGDVLTSVPRLAGTAAVVVEPDFGLATAEVYAACRPSDFASPDGPDRTAEAAEALRTGRLDRLARFMTNGLEAVAERLAPAIARLRNAFDACGCVAHQLSGSGSAYFGLFRTVGEARRVAETLRGLRVGKTRLTTIL